jgi:hypothetical protein
MPSKKPVTRKKMQAGGAMRRNLDRTHREMQEGRDARRAERAELNRATTRDTPARRAPVEAARRRTSAERSAAERRGARGDANRDRPTGVQRTGGGNYTTYRADSAPAKSFRERFAEASRKGQKTFTWRGRRYTTERA